MRDKPQFKLHANTKAMFCNDGEADLFKSYLDKRCPDLKPESRRRIVRIVGYGLDCLGVDQMNLAITDIDRFQRKLVNTDFRAHGYPAYLRRSLKNAARYVHVLAHDGDGADVRALSDHNRGAPHADTDEAPFQLVPRTNADRGAGARKAAPKPAKSTKRTPQRHGGTAGRARPLPTQPTLEDLDAALDQLIALQLKLGPLNRREIRELISRVLAVLDDASLVKIVGAVPGGYRRNLARTAPRKAPRNLRGVAEQVVQEALEARHAHRLTA